MAGDSTVSFRLRVSAGIWGAGSALALCNCKSECISPSDGKKQAWRLVLGGTLFQDPSRLHVFLQQWVWASLPAAAGVSQEAPICRGIRGPMCWTQHQASGPSSPAALVRPSEMSPGQKGCLLPHPRGPGSALHVVKNHRQIRIPIPIRLRERDGSLSLSI